jgi:hypothetical protein
MQVICILKDSVFWDVGPYRYCVNRRFGGTYRLHLEGRRKYPRAKNQRGQSAVTCSRCLLAREFFSSTLKMEAISSSETSISTRCHIPGDGILHSHRRENLKSYNMHFILVQVTRGHKVRTQEDFLCRSWCWILEISGSANLGHLKVKAEYKCVLRVVSCHSMSGWLMYAYNSISFTEWA